MNGKPWAPEEIRRLRALYPGLATREAAKRLNRSGA